MADRRPMTMTAFLRAFGVLLVASGGLCATTPSLAFVYSSEAVRLRVVVEGTGAPLAGAIAVAYWEVEHPSLVTGTVYRPVAIHEAVTDAQGWVEFPAWKAEKPWKASYTSGAPRVLLYRENYRPLLLANEVTMERDVVQPAKSRWNGKTVPMARFEGTLKQWLVELVILDANLPSLWYDREDLCNFEKLPKMLAALDREDVRFEQAKMWPQTVARGMRARESFLAANGCKKVSDIMREGAQP